MKFSVSIPGKKLRKETRASLVRVGKEVAALSDAVLSIVSTNGFVFSDSQNTFEIKVSRSAIAKAEEGEEL